MRCKNLTAWRNKYYKEGLIEFRVRLQRFITPKTEKISFSYLCDEMLSPANCKMSLKE